MLKVEALILALHPRSRLPLASHLKAVGCLELAILARSVIGIALVEVLTLGLGVSVVSLISFPSICQIVFAQAHFLLLDLAAILAILCLLGELSLLECSLILLREEIAHQAKTLGEAIHPATGV
ncbi:hypothetical protein [Pseudomonas sp. ICMP 460]|uniref:hypothetical protein n=1 Tax=Pseudomonas sp. ICMP 460 TaxID=1718917 RepID=UPI000C06B8FB|nr:hypothetical protein [Pseudomonas sp. ICMP 460]PHN29409.1 hypothetical protein AO240_20500 [Pseudomonas sp. ICMP 460]